MKKRGRKFEKRVININSVNSQNGRSKKSEVLIPVIEFSTGKQLIVDMGKLKRSNVQIHKTLPEPLRRRIRKVYKVISEVHFTNLQGFENGMKTEGHPEREVYVFELIAEAYIAFIEGKTLSFEKKQDVYQIILGLSFGISYEKLLQDSHYLTTDDLLDLINGWKQISKGVNTYARIKN